MTSSRRRFMHSASAGSLAIPFFSPLVFGDTLQNGRIPPFPQPGDPDYWRKVRNQFLLARDKVFFNNGTIGVTPRVVLDKVIEHMTRMATDIADWDYRGDDWIAGYGPQTTVRTKAAKLLNADVKEVALTENVTCAMSYVADGLDLPADSEVIISDQEHPGGQSSWLVAQKRRHVAVKVVKLPKPAQNPEEIIDRINAAITPKTRVIAISHVISGSGAILPVKEICAEARKRNIFTVLDGAHAVGHIPVDVRAIGCDAYVGCFHKWLLAPPGNGFLYVRSERAQDVWSTLASAQWDNHEDEGYRFSQRGTGSLSMLVGMEAALDFHESLGPERVQQRVKLLGDRLREGLRSMPKVVQFSPHDPAMCAGITVYNVEGVTGARLQDEMWAHGRMRPRSMGDVFGVRQCTHIYNSPEEVDATLRVVSKLASA
ncbi:MAG: aminotransferase class V-fold PLP-dependent enzyme [Acidobacteriaceae bacterium]|nr:aminotransferase class V-fold PLP-dependent enzyme [Acidobacteriaceae bacterium]